MTTANLLNALSPLRRGRGFCLELGEFDAPVDVIEADVHPASSRKGDQAGRSLGRDGLPALVVANVALGASHARRKGLLGDAKTLSDGFDRVHVAIVAPLLPLVNSATALPCNGLPVPFAPMNAAPRKAKVTEESRQESVLLKKLWDSRKGNKLSQAEFGETWKIGGQSAVGQFLRGDVPLSLNAAKGFAAGLGCNIGDFSPRLAKIAAEAGMHAGGVADPETPLDLTSLNRMEMQMVMMYRKLDPEQQADLMQHINHLVIAAHPAKSRANPFPHAPVPPTTNHKEKA